MIYEFDGHLDLAFYINYEEFKSWKKRRNRKNGLCFILTMRNLNVDIEYTVRS